MFRVVGYGYSGQGKKGLVQYIKELEIKVDQIKFQKDNFGDSGKDGIREFSYEDYDIFLVNNNKF